MKTLSFTISSSTLSRLNLIRQLQIAKFMVEQYRKEESLPGDGSPEIDREWMGVKMEGQERMIRVNLLNKWAKTFGDEAVLSLSLEGDGNLILKHGKTSVLKTFTIGIERDGQGKPLYRQGYGIPVYVSEPIPFTVNVFNGELTLDTANESDNEEQLQSLRAEVSKARKLLSLGKQFAKARENEKRALRQLTEEKERASAYQATLDGMTLQNAISLARRVLTARRLWAKTVNDLSVIPSWLPETFIDEERAELDETSQDYIYARKTIKTTDELNPLITSYVAARDARLSYKPRMSWPCYVSYEGTPKAIAAFKKLHPELATPVYGPAFDKLKEAEQKAHRQVVNFLRDRFIEWCSSCDLPGGENLTYSYLSREMCAYSYARNWLKGWEDRKAELQSLYDEAKMKREGIEGKAEKMEEGS